MPVVLTGADMRRATKNRYLDLSGNMHILSPQHILLLLAIALFFFLRPRGKPPVHPLPPPTQLSCAGSDSFAMASSGTLVSGHGSLDVGSNRKKTAY
jgi:hypothetical protein